MRESAAGTSQLSISNRNRRAALFQKSNGRCFYCGDPVFEPGCSHGRDWLMVRSHDSRLAREHMIPVVRGGDDRPVNIVAACTGCNTRKGSFDTDEFRLLMALRSGDLDFRFPGEPAVSVKRDWLICHSPAVERDLLIHNAPSSAKAYNLRNGFARGQRARRK